MKKVNLTFLLLFIAMHLVAPPVSTSLYIPSDKVIIDPNWVKYEPLADAVYHYESNCNPLAYNPLERAVGGFQIRQVRVNDYNQLTGCSYKLEDFYDYNLSKNMFIFYAQGKSFEMAAKNWNGSGPKTIDYWKNVKALL